jgi:hypothetical protein
MMLSGQRSQATARAVEPALYVSEIWKLGW